MNEDMMTEAERASIAADGTDGLLGKRGKGVFHIHTLGCQMNVHDSERIAGVLEANGYVPATEDQINDNDLDLLVLNTCAVRENAAERMYGTIGRFNRVKLVRPNLQIAVGGCMAQLDRKKIADTAPWVSAVFGTKNIEDLPKLLDQNRATGKAQVQVTEQLRQFPSQLPAARASRISSWVAISVGCNNTCTFCIVPTTRGKEKDRRPGDILDEIRQCVADGAKEVTLLGQNVNSFGYGIGDRYAFSKLLRACGTIDGLERVRFTSPHPAAFTDDVIAAMAETPNIMHQLHFPLQSGSDRILRAMRRSYRSAKFLDILGRIRAAMPDAQISTDIIVASPAKPKRTSSRPWTWCARRASPRRSRSSTRHAPARRRRNGTDSARRGAGPVRPSGGVAGADHRREPRHIRGPRRRSDDHRQTRQEGHRHPPCHRPRENRRAGAHRRA